jgi:Na+/melibiose symporter-like transporter
LYSASSSSSGDNRDRSIQEVDLVVNHINKMGKATAVASRSLAIAYGVTSFSAAALHNIFITYYVHLFLHTYKLDSTWFYIGELIFMVWNAVNDPWFGWMIEERRSTVVSTKLYIIAIGGVGWCLSFVLLFFPFASAPIDVAVDGGVSSSFTSWSTLLTALHFTISLFLYDAMLSLVMLANASLLTDIAESNDERVRCNTYSSVFSGIGSASVFVSHMYWDKDDVVPFQTFCCALALVAVVGFLYSGLTMRAHYLRAKLRRSSNTSLSSAPSSSPPSSSTATARTLDVRPSLGTFVSQLYKQRNFWIWVSFSLVQVFNCHYNSNFMSIFLDSFLSLTYSPAVHSTVVCLASTFPHILVVLFSPFVKKHGMYTSPTLQVQLYKSNSTDCIR